MVQDKMGEMNNTSNPIINTFVSCSNVVSAPAPASPDHPSPSSAPISESTVYLSLRDCISAFLRSETTIMYDRTEVRNFFI